MTALVQVRLTLEEVARDRGVEPPERVPCPVCRMERRPAEIVTTLPDDDTDQPFLCANCIQEPLRAAAALIEPTLAAIEVDALAIVDAAQTARARDVVSPGEDKAQIYEELRTELADLGNFTTMTSLNVAGLNGRFPAMAAMIDVMVPGAVTIAQRRSALQDIAAMVREGQDASRSLLRRMNALRVKAKADVRAAGTAAEKLAIARAAAAAIRAVG